MDKQDKAGSKKVILPSPLSLEFGKPQPTVEFGNITNGTTG